MNPLGTTDFIARTPRSGRRSPRRCAGPRASRRQFLEHRVAGVIATIASPIEAAATAQMSLRSCARVEASLRDHVHTLGRAFFSVAMGFIAARVFQLAVGDAAFRTAGAVRRPVEPAVAAVLDRVVHLRAARARRRLPAVADLDRLDRLDGAHRASRADRRACGPTACASRGPGITPVAMTSKTPPGVSPACAAAWIASFMRCSASGSRQARSLFRAIIFMSAKECANRWASTSPMEPDVGEDLDAEAPRGRRRHRTDRHARTVSRCGGALGMSRRSCRSYFRPPADRRGPGAGA